MRDFSEHTRVVIDAMVYDISQRHSSGTQGEDILCLDCAVNHAGWLATAVSLSHFFCE